MGNEALRLIERLEAALLAEHGCYSHYRVVCPGCDLCKEAREFLAAQRREAEALQAKQLADWDRIGASAMQPAPKCDAEYGGHPDRGTTYCDLPKFHAGTHSWEQPTEPPIEISEEEWESLEDRFKLACCEQSCGCGGYETLKKIGRNGFIAARRGVAPCNLNPSPTKEKP